MPRLKRKGNTETFSVSVSAETKARLRRAADRTYGGNVSALIEAIAREAERQDALDWLIRWSGPVDDARYADFLSEMGGKPKRRRRR